ncbi:excinuclease ABC subunit UvrB, partial [Candidatus Dependentiae bacterium]|nr:excinuclease ABC subunit UvrB [Candidatus Dependentiae bacterium]
MFKLVSDYKPAGDQPQAIKKISKSILADNKENVLLGVTGSGKTFTMANIISEINKPTLVISHNKTLAAQLYDEFRQFFPDNAVEYFVSFYDYYQPEAYIPSTDTFIEKDSDINEEIDRMRLAATSSLLSRKDVIIIASVSCIYGLGSPIDYEYYVLHLKTNTEINRKIMFSKLVNMQYSRNDLSSDRGTFRVAGDIIEIYLAYKKTCIRIQFWGDMIEKIEEINPVTKNVERIMTEEFIFPAKHFMTTPEKLDSALESIRVELSERLDFFYKHNRVLEAQRLQQRTEYDIEMLTEMNYCSGIENYSRHLSGRTAGSTPYTLFDYFPKDFLTIIDESHATIPQLRAMYNGDYSRKKTLVDFGFRLPSALDNRPLKFEEFLNKINYTLYVSATPADYELEKSSIIVEQIIRPTGLVDPEIIVKPAKNQVDDVVGEINETVIRNERVLVTTLTIKMAEQLTEYLKKLNIKVQYLHSKIETLDRIKILHSLRKGEFDVLVGINLLREGLDLPEVSLVAILDADKEGFLRSERSLIQVSGRASRNINGRVIMYANTITKSMKNAISETHRRRKKQLEYNKKNNITPESIKRNIFSESKLLNIDDNNKSLIKEKYLEKIKINPDSSNAELITEL